jgi:hypothetical protein
MHDCSSQSHVHVILQAGVKAVADLDALTAAKAAPIMTYGSPSAVKAWVALAGHDVASKQVGGRVCWRESSLQVTSNNKPLFVLSVWE